MGIAVPVLHRDFETRSTAPLKKAGTRRYAADPTTQVLCICYAVGNGPVESFIPEAGKPIPTVFIEAATNPDWFVVAHNDAFESAIEEYVLGRRYGFPLVPIERHICTVAMARYHGLPGELGKVAALLKLPVQKDKDGAKVMLELCKPRKPHKGEDKTQVYWVEVTPTKLDRLITYCKNDVVVEREIFHRLPQLPETERRLWCLDRKINMRGFRVDLELDHAARKLVQAEQASINAKIRATTAGAAEGSTKLNDMRKFINAHGHNMSKFNKRAVTAVLSHDPDDVVREVLGLRQASSNTAVEKYRAVLASAFPDQRIYGLLNYYGTHTGRWSSAGFNAHNLPREDSADALAAIAAIRAGELEQVRTFGTPLNVIARVVRGLVIAPPNKLLLAGDFSVIEPRVASWFAEEKWKLDTFRKFDETGDPMLDAHRVVGARMSGRPVDPTDEEARQHGKTVHMALNYGGSVPVWRKQVPNDPRNDAEIKAQEIDRFRQLHPAQTQFMYNLSNQAMYCVRSRKPVQRKRYSFEMDGDTLILRLPSGRPLFYPRTHITSGKFGKGAVAYHNPAKNCEDEMWYGAWLAHLVSATSRDLLVNALFNLDDAGFEVILHVHDEIVAEIDLAHIERDRGRFKACMLQTPEWAAGLPLAAKVRIGERYLKADEATIMPELAEAPAPQCFLEAVEMPDRALIDLESVPECAHCRRNLSDDNERPNAYGGFWLHTNCEEPFIHARMTDEGISAPSRQANGDASPGVDREQIETFVLALFKHATAGHWISLRAFHEDRADLPPFKITPYKLNGDFSILINQAYHDAELAAHEPKKIVFCPPIATFTTHAHAREVDLAEGLTLSTECDAHAQAARMKLEALLGPATVTVESGGTWANPTTGQIEPKLHTHYRLQTPARNKNDQAKLKLARKLATAIVGGDSSNVPLVHPIRWPGSLHRKRDPKLCRIVSLNPDAEISLDFALGVLQTAAGNSGAPQTSTNAPMANWGELLEDVLAGESYHEPLIRLAAKLITSGTNARAAADLLRGLMEASAGPHDERWQTRYDDIERCVSTAWAKFGPQQVPKPATLECTLAADEEMEALDWIWPGRYALGKIGLLVGLPDEGKGLALSDIMARITRGLPWPCDEGQAPIGNVVLLTAEDDINDTIIPRLAAAGADRNRVTIIRMMREGSEQRMFSLISDLSPLRQKVIELGNVRMILIDPITAYLGIGKIDSFRATDVRAVLGPLKELAAELRLSILAVMHFNKKVDITNVLLRISDSLAYGAAARHVYGVIDDPDNARKLFVKGKNNLAPRDQKTLAFGFAEREVGVDKRTAASIRAPYIVWHTEPVDITATEAMQAAAESKSPGARDNAKQFLQALLSDGPVASKKCKKRPKKTESRPSRSGAPRRNSKLRSRRMVHS
jgi:DNA polymerase